MSSMSSIQTLPHPTPPVTFVGIGPGDADLLTVRAARLLARAALVVADRPLDAALRRLVAPEAEVVEDAAARPPAEVAKSLAAAARSGRLAVRLLPGDPFVGARGPQEVEALAKSGHTWEIVPGIPSALAVAGCAGVPLLTARHPEVGLACASEDADWRALAGGPRTLVLESSIGDVGKLAARLVEHGRPGDSPVAVTCGGATTSQQTVVSTLDAAETDVANAGLAGDCVVVVGDAVRQREKLSWFETRPLFGWRVLVPRTKDQAGTLSEQLRSYGAVPVEVPTIAVEPPRSPAQMERAVRGLVSGRYQWVVFTSQNAVRAIRERFEEYGLDARAFAGVKVAAVGEQTARRLVEFGVMPELVPSGEQTSEGLVADFPPYDDIFDPINRVLLPRADIATETLVSGLTELGWECEDVTAYRTVRAAPPPAEIRDAIKSGGFDAVLFTSASTVRNLVGIAGKPHTSTVIAVIGPATEAAAEEQGLRVDVRAPRASVAALAEALAEHGRAVRQAAIEAGEWTGRPGRPKPAKTRRR